MRIKEQLLVVMDFVACLTKIEAMRAANDCRRMLNTPPMFSTADFTSCINHIQHTEDSIASKDFSSFVRKLLKGKEQKN